jgi:hypothetical protein
MKQFPETTMTNPAMPNLPGFGAIAESMEMVRNMWGGASAPGIGIPGMVMPSLSVEDINKQIADLKAVESWLTLNMNMLRGTIQALEVQSATISTLRSMGESLSASVKSATPAAAVPAAFSYPFGMPAAAAPAPKPMPAAAAPPEPALPAAEVEPAESPMSTKKSAAAKSAAAPAFGAPLANPAAWWTMLQDQFKQAVGTAMNADAAPAPAKPARKAPVAAFDATGSGWEVPPPSPPAGTDAPSRSAAARRKPAAKKPAKPALKRPAGTTAKTVTKAAPKTAPKTGSS